MARAGFAAELKQPMLRVFHQRRDVMINIFRLAIFLAVSAAPAAGAEDVARGRELFEPCRSCHAREVGKTGMAGPDLAELKGRRIAGAIDFDYSPAMKRGYDSGAVWDEKRLMEFLADSDEMFPGLWMSARPMANESDRRALAAFLLSAEK